MEFKRFKHYQLTKRDAEKLVAWLLRDGGIWFSYTPYPDDQVLITIKNEGQPLAHDIRPIELWLTDDFRI